MATEQDTHNTKNSQWHNLTELFQSIVVPYKTMFIGQNVYEGTCTLFDLLETHGSCPSVVTVNRNDGEAADLRGINNILSQITLKDHTCRVVNNAVELLRKEYRDFEAIIPMIVIMALGHDIGKIPVLRETSEYMMSDHPIISASKVEEVFLGRDIPWLPRALEAIKSHHRYSGDPFSLILKQADQMAREVEVTEISKKHITTEWDQWFDITEFFQMIGSKINVIGSGNKWQAFSFGSVVYCLPDFLYSSAKTLVETKNAINKQFLYRSMKEQALRNIVIELRNKGCLAHEIADEYFGRHYDVSWKVKRYGVKELITMKMYLVPIKVELFGLSHFIEENKKGTYFQTIHEVKFAKWNSPVTRWRKDRCEDFVSTKY